VGERFGRVDRGFAIAHSGRQRAAQLDAALAQHLDENPEHLGVFMQRCVGLRVRRLFGRRGSRRCVGAAVEARISRREPREQRRIGRRVGMLGHDTAAHLLQRVDRLQQ
jgi:hypothetical protein